MTFGKLHHPNRQVIPAPVEDAERAITIAQRVLCENGIAEFSVSGESITDWNGFYILGYRNTAQPDLAYGGNAILVVRQNDGLGGMVQSSPDWIEQDIDKLHAPIVTAFAKFDEEQTQTPGRRKK
ncbi:MAG: hypothetical protein ABJL99_10435 [Aliishimia sp.]